MSLPELLANVEGANAFAEWFGGWPSFHDAEILSFNFSRGERSTLVIHVFRRTSDLTPSGHYKHDKNAIVQFSTSEVLNGSLEGFNHQNVIFGLTIERDEDAYRIVLDPCYGLSGNLLCKDLSISYNEGLPTVSAHKPID